MLEFLFLPSMDHDPLSQPVAPIAQGIRRAHNDFMSLTEHFVLPMEKNVNFLLYQKKIWFDSISITETIFSEKFQLYSIIWNKKSFLTPSTYSDCKARTDLGYDDNWKIFCLFLQYAVVNANIWSLCWLRENEIHELQICL